MRILHVIHRLDREAGGTTALTLSMCEALAARGHDISLFALQRGAFKNTAFETRLFRPDMPGFSRSMAGALRSKIPQCDLVHIHMLYRPPQAVAAHFARGAKIPYCMQPHGALDPVMFHKRERRFAKRLYEALVERRNLRRAAGLVFTTAGERDATAFLKLGVPGYVVPAGLDLSQYQQSADVEAFRARHRLAGKDIILWMGRISRVKALPVLAQAFAVLAAQYPNAALVIAGPDQDGERPELENSLRAAGLLDRVLFTGMIQDGEKLAALKAARLFVLPSYTENFGISAMEAMAVGCPVIVSNNVKLAPEIVAQGAGLSVPVEGEKLAAAMASLLGDERECAAMGLAAQKLAAQHDWSIVAQRLEQAYQAMLSAGAPAS
jgi:glycosyltransferase involved in cell wall biosynthesis